MVWVLMRMTLNHELSTYVIETAGTDQAYVNGTFILDKSMCPHRGLIGSRFRVFVRKPLMTSPSLDYCQSSFTVRKGLFHTLATRAIPSSYTKCNCQNLDQIRFCPLMQADEEIAEWVTTAS
jgi:hypothetical protein